MLAGRPLPSRRRSGWFAPPLPRVLAHRGLATTHPENTLGAFRAAVDCGAEYIELDVHASSDGCAIVAHDPTLTRLLGVDDTIGAHTAAELAALDLGGGEGFSTLAEVLTALPRTRFNIDIKSESAVWPAAAEIVACGAVDRVLVTSFSDARRRAAVALLPGVATSASARGFVLALLASKVGLTGVVRRVLRDVDAVQVPERALGMRVPTRRVLAGIHSAGVEMHVWTINDPATMASLLAVGVDGLITDRADLALDLVGAIPDGRGDEPPSSAQNP